MTTYQAIVEDICHHPEDDGLRRIAADWLEDHGQAARAAFIRDGLAGNEHQAWRWFGDIPAGGQAPQEVWPAAYWASADDLPFNMEFCWRRGFVERVLARAHHWFDNDAGDCVLARHPVTRLDLKLPRLDGWTAERMAPRWMRGRSLQEVNISLGNHSAAPSLFSQLCQLLNPTRLIVHYELGPALGPNFDYW